MKEILDAILYVLIYGFSTLFILAFLLELQIAFEKQLAGSPTYSVKNIVQENQGQATAKALSVTNKKCESNTRTPSMTHKYNTTYSTRKSPKTRTSKGKSCMRKSAGFESTISSTTITRNNKKCRTKLSPRRDGNGRVADSKV